MATQTAEEKQQAAAAAKAAAEAQAQEQNEWNTAALLLEPYVGRLITYRDDGERAGYLVRIHRNMDGIANACHIQPIGAPGDKPKELIVTPTDCKPYDGNSKHPTLESYAAANWNKKKAVLIVAGGPVQQRLNIAIQQHLAEQQKVKMIDVMESKPEPTDMLLVHDEVIVGHHLVREAEKAINNGTLVTAAELNMAKVDTTATLSGSHYVKGMRRADAVATIEFKEKMDADIAARPTVQACKHGHDLTNPEHIHVGDLMRTGKRTCNTCWKAAAAK